MIIGLVIATAIFLTPSFLVTYGAPNKTWLLIALILAPLFFYKGVVATGEPCGASLGVFAMPEPSDNWLVNFLALVVGAGLRSFTMLIGGRFDLLLRLALVAPALLILGFFSYRLVHWFEALAGLGPCS
jgi:hypothetical protein